ncbi:MAG: hypothetical protein KA248_01960 [Kiritimatiellae bacterium]|nr:hypothetical protein [Kiritimatiellia bacterium]
MFAFSSYGAGKALWLGLLWAFAGWMPDAAAAPGRGFHQPGLAYDAVTGLTFDGHRIDPKTGRAEGGPRRWSAASKESLHLALLALALDGNPEAQAFVCPGSPDRAPALALDLLTRKIETYEHFDRRYPGFGGCLPWFEVAPDGIVPSDEWGDAVPGLDNGQFAWSLRAVTHVLAARGHPELASRYRAAFDRISDHCVMMFYDPAEGKVRAECRVLKPGMPPSFGQYDNPKPGYWLDDPFEGELLLVLMALHGRWPDPDAAERIWRNRRWERREYETPEGLVTVGRGFRFSSHEQWKYLVLPYTDVDLARRILANEEKARTWYSRREEIPGLLASANDTSEEGEIRYVSDLGIRELAETNVAQDIVTPYAAFPVILTDREVGLEWLQVMLDAPRMRGPCGVTEAIRADGARISPMVTWDVNGTLALARAGGLGTSLRQAMESDGVYERFLALVRLEYRKMFPGPVHGDTVPMARPSAAQPRLRADFAGGDSPTPVIQAGIPILQNTRFEGGGQIRFFRSADGGLVIQGGPGWLWSWIPPVDLQDTPVLTATIRSRNECDVWLELKDALDRSLVGRPRHGVRKVRWSLPNTRGRPEAVTLDLAPWLTSDIDRHVARILVFSDAWRGAEILTLDFRQGRKGDNP